MASTSHINQLGYFSESTIGTPPADAAAWVSSGTRVKIVKGSADISGVKRAWVANNNSITSINEKHQNVAGLRNCEASWEQYIHGTGSVTSDTSQVTAITLSNMLQDAWGGQNRTYSTTCTGGTATQPTVAADTGIDEGVFLAFEDQDDADRVHIRRVTAWSTPTVTLDEALPFTPANGDPVHACITIFIDRAALVDSSDGNYRTASYLFDNTKNTGHDEDLWELRGAKPELDLSNIAPRADLPRIGFNAKAGSFAHESLSAPSWTGTPDGEAPLVTGVDTHVWLQDYGTTTQNSVQVWSFSPEVSVPIVPVDTVTALNVNMDGRHAYTTMPADIQVKLSVPFQNAYKDDIEAGTFKVMRYARVAEAGKAWALHFSRMEYMTDPDPQDQTENRALELTLRAHEDTDNASAGDADLWKTPIALILA